MPWLILALLLTIIVLFSVLIDCLLAPRLRVYIRSLTLALSLIPSSNLISSSYTCSLVTRLKVLLG